MIIAYHPPIFKPLSSLTLSNPLQASLLRCAAAGVSIYSPHTALDSVYGGINDWLASGLGVGRIDLIGDEHSSGKGGHGRLLRLYEKTTMSSLQERVKKHLGLPQSLCTFDSRLLFNTDIPTQSKWHYGPTLPTQMSSRLQFALAQGALCYLEWTQTFISLGKCHTYVGRRTLEFSKFHTHMLHT